MEYVGITPKPSLTSTLYLHGLNDYPLVEKTSTTERRYIYGPTGVIVIKEGTSKRYVQKDHLGSTRVLYDESGVAVTVYEYDAYGKCIGRVENTQAQYRFTGQEFEVESGLHNFRARPYDDDGIIFYATDPANQNYAPYSYCLGNPIKYVDPTGRFGDTKYYLDGNEISQQVYEDNFSSQVSQYIQAKQHYYSTNGMQLGGHYETKNHSVNYRVESIGKPPAWQMYSWSENVWISDPVATTPPQFLTDFTNFSLSASNQLFYSGLALSGITLATPNPYTATAAYTSFTGSMTFKAANLFTRGVNMYVYNNEDKNLISDAIMFGVATVCASAFGRIANAPLGNLKISSYDRQALNAIDQLGHNILSNQIERIPFPLGSGGSTSPAFQNRPLTPSDATRVVIREPR
jgi:RHS repeat-associated protein